MLHHDLEALHYKKPKSKPTQASATGYSSSARSPDPTSIFISIPVIPYTPTITSTTKPRSTSKPSETPRSTSCPTLFCQPSSHTCPPCQSGYTCRLDVIDSSCQCPVASCVKADSVTGENIDRDLSPSSGTSTSKAVLPVALGCIAGLVIFAAILFLFIWHRRKGRKAATGPIRLKDEEDRINERETEAARDPFNNSDKKLNHNSVHGKNDQKDVIQIAYIPSVPNVDLTKICEIEMLGGAPQAPFADKGSSLASRISTSSLDEAIVLGVNQNVVPKVYKLNTIKANNSDLIQRSNSLHASNSIKRARSQKRALASRKQAEAANEDEQKDASGDSSNTKQQEVQQQYTPAVFVTAPSVRSSAQSTASATWKPKHFSIVVEPRPLNPSYYTRQSSSSPPSPKLVQSPTDTADIDSDPAIHSYILPSPSPSVSITAPKSFASMKSPSLSMLPLASSPPHSVEPQGRAHSKINVEESLRDEDNHGTSWVEIDLSTPIKNSFDVKFDIIKPPRSIAPSSSFSTHPGAR
ncbi:hypothetical protein BX616_001908 [Lobosporangium transversale]|uniref:Membrane anchor Opy2 N-terminal domain-containing protein n=1 Tax=Lobosporangium transversale TaxID=64571 RepID=A0A1Y2GZJ6_9FUNG|nr:hypothetical protein BCR41DRAFT_392929 [Lobosporangium transversale]KAF9902534.1 hypothetical protein BX616_001908 [Lobosporangium transversale]ORZ26893.1 hypothetical protein BCR41DRAFT_392929 [Lobosporangium transversale]|eukprot:XP_021884640.1 hypothetical protein BCR41DRAFT_392929 [Lobosporangium transversale]